MGKPFANELNDLPVTYHWAMSQNVDALVMHLWDAVSFPLLAVGSGGSLSAAHLAVLLHQQHGMVAKAATPLDLRSTTSFTIPHSAVLFLSAGGGNPDVLSGFQQAAISEARHLFGICMKPDSPLRDMAGRFHYAHFFDYGLPCGKDGFLATNSLLAFFILLIRAYESGQPNSDRALPDQLSVPPASIERLLADGATVLKRDSLLVLHEGWAQPVAADIESKFSEAALGNIHPTDYRNFGHGRHHWLAKRGDTTGVIALITPEGRSLAERTLSLLPNNVPVLRVHTDTPGPAGTVDLYVQMLYLVNLAGALQGIDPGRPGVPRFGRQLYHLSIKSDAGTNTPLAAREHAAIQRKCYPRPLGSLPDGELGEWRLAYQEFVGGLKRKRFDGIVLDYDGTLCAPSDRHTGLRGAVVEQMLRLLRAGIRIGIATGRGASVQEALLPHIPSELQQDVIVSYFNGAVIHPLCDAISAQAYAPPCDDLEPIAEHLKREGGLLPLAEVSLRHWQITLKTRPGVGQREVLDLLDRYLWEHVRSGGKVLNSSHSIDIVPGYVSKRSLIQHFINGREVGGQPRAVLCIGDRGRQPGNDYELLQEPCSLSVDEVAPDRGTCWNLAMPGHRGVQATLEYLRSLSPGTKSTFSFLLPATKGRDA